MLITELVKRLEELRRVESDIHVVFSDPNGMNVVKEFELDVYTDEDMNRKVMVYPMYPMEGIPIEVENESLHVDLEPSVQEEALQAMQDVEEQKYEEQPVRVQESHASSHERTSRQGRSRKT